MVFLRYINTLLVSLFILYCKIKAMTNRKTVAILGVSNICNSCSNTSCPRAHAVLLLIRIKVAFKYLRTATLENPNAQVEPMRCPTNASWEADYCGFCLANESITQQIRKVSTGKIVLILESITDEKKIRLYLKYYFFSKIIYCFEAK
jgi:hypothetical protein